MASARETRRAAVAQADRDRQVVDLKRTGLTFREIAAQLGLSLGTVHKSFNRGLTRVVEPAVTEYRAEHVARLATLREVVEDVINRRHLVVSDGRIVRDGADLPLEDDGVVLAAADRLLKIDEAERRLLGLDAKPELEISGNLSYRVIGLDDDGPG